MFVEATQNGELKRRVQMACSRNKLRIKVVEKMSSTIKSNLQRNNPFGWSPCNRTDCPICSRGLKVNCRARGCVYEITCTECQQTVEKIYRGQTGRSLYERMKEHMRCWNEKSEESCLHAHAEKCHGGGQFLINIRLLKECYGKPTARMVSEAVLIEDLPTELSLNSKAEWNYVSLPRLTVS